MLTVKTKVSRLERHLHESVWTEPMARDEILPIAFELQRLTVILADQIAESCLRELDPNA